uniref:DIS3-like exonuclease 1 n=1 Tax=Hucho hucho TaxID=62062 RepID=A0A4W5Q585_9TELE
MIKTEKVLHLKSSRGRKVRVVREHYLREHVPCYSSLCQAQCANEGKVLSGEVTHYVIPDAGVARDFMEILEFREIQGIVFTQTACQAVQHSRGRRQYNRLRSLLKDPRHHCILFANEFQEYSYCPREKGEPQDKWQTRCVYHAAVWYHDHLAGLKPVVMITEDQTAVAEYSSLNCGVYVLSTQEYLQTFWPELQAALELYCSIAQSLQERGSEETEREYTEHLPAEVLEAGIKSGRYIQAGGGWRGHVCPQGWVLNPLLYTLFTHDCMATHASNSIIKFADDTTVVGLITNNDKEVRALETAEGAPPYPHRRDRSGEGGKLQVPRLSSPPSLQDHRVIVRLDSWDSTSLYPNGHSVRVLGRAGELETEVQTILIENCIHVPPFSEAQVGYSIIHHPHIDLCKFESLINCYGMSLVLRATTYYLADRRYDMLPAVLSADLCSLLGGVDRYAMSVMWDLDAQTLAVNKVWYGRTLIQSSYQLYYELAQALLNGEEAEVPELGHISKVITVRSSYNSKVITVRSSYHSKIKTVELVPDLLVLSCQHMVTVIKKGYRNTLTTVCVARYGLKGAVYLKNREGQVVSERQDGGCDWQTGSLQRYLDHITTTTAAGTSTFNLFQHITVRISVQPSRCHSDTLRLEVVSNRPHQAPETQAQTPQPQGARGRSQLVQEVVRQAEEASQQAEEKRGRAPKLSKEEREFRQSKCPNLYSLLEEVRELALLDLAACGDNAIVQPGIVF